MGKKSVIIGIVIVLLAVIAGGIYMKNQKEAKAKAEEEAFWEKQKPRIELYFRYNFKDVKTFTYTKTGRTPMSVYIEGYIDNDPKYEFSADVLGGESEFNGNITLNPELSARAKSSTNKSVDEILEEQKENQ